MCITILIISVPIILTLLSPSEFLPFINKFLYFFHVFSFRFYKVLCFIKAVSMSLGTGLFIGPQATF